MYELYASRVDALGDLQGLTKEKQTAGNPLLLRRAEEVVNRMLKGIWGRWRWR